MARQSPPRPRAPLTSTTTVARPAGQANGCRIRDAIKGLERQQ